MRELAHYDMGRKLLELRPNQIPERVNWLLLHAGLATIPYPSIHLRPYRVLRMFCRLKILDSENNTNQEN
jgi:hypothetical protein